MKPLTAVGYVRSPFADAPKRDESVELIESYVDRHSLRLRCVYRDDGMSSFYRRRSGFTRVIDDLRAGVATVVIVPAAYHLSWHPNTRACLVTLIRNAGGQLYIAQPVIAEPPLSSAPDGDAS